jgi:type IV pilus assembly protein PilV
MIRRTPHTRPRGFTLMEVMVAVLVISLGLLGIAAMQANAIASTHSSQMESLVAIEAQSLASAMTANPWWLQAEFPASITVNGNSVSPSSMVSSVNCGTTACTGTELASYDLATWGTQLQKLVPGAQATVACQAGAPIMCSITVTWTPEATVALNSGTTTNAPTTNSMSYTLVNQF